MYWFTDGSRWMIHYLQSQSNKISKYLHVPYTSSICPKKQSRNKNNKLTAPWNRPGCPLQYCAVCLSRRWPPSKKVVWLNAASWTLGCKKNYDHSIFAKSWLLMGDKGPTAQTGRDGITISCSSLKHGLNLGSCFVDAEESKIGCLCKWSSAKFSPEFVCCCSLRNAWRLSSIMSHPRTVASKYLSGKIATAMVSTKLLRSLKKCGRHWVMEVRVLCVRLCWTCRTTEDSSFLKDTLYAAVAHISDTLEQSSNSFWKEGLFWRSPFRVKWPRLTRVIAVIAPWIS